MRRLGYKGDGWEYCFCLTFFLIPFLILASENNLHHSMFLIFRAPNYFCVKSCYKAFHLSKQCSRL